MKTYLWKSTIVPQVALVGEAVADETQFTLLDVLFDRVQEFLFRNLGFVF
jgi:hypothetical protein